jgi:hypothetical protein
MENRINVGFNFDVSVDKKLNAFCKQQGFKKVTFVEAAILAHIERMTLALKEKGLLK